MSKKKLTFERLRSLSSRETSAREKIFVRGLFDRFGLREDTTNGSKKSQNEVYKTEHAYIGNDIVHLMARSSSGPVSKADTIKAYRIVLRDPMNLVEGSENFAYNWSMNQRSKRLEEIRSQLLGAKAKTCAIRSAIFYGGVKIVFVVVERTLLVTEAYEVRSQ